MEQTAVEWLVEQLKTMDTKSFNRLIQIEMSRENFEECFEQAKAMEKEMMNKNIKFICHGCGTKHTGENDDQMYEVCKQCFTNL